MANTARMEARCIMDKGCFRLFIQVRGFIVDGMKRQPNRILM